MKKKIMYLVVVIFITLLHKINVADAAPQADEFKLYQCICSDKSCQDYTADTASLPDAKKECSACKGEFKPGNCPEDKLPVAELQKEAKQILNPAKFASGKQGVFQIIGKMIIFSLFPIGAITMALYIWAGFLWMTAQGNSENVQKAQKILVWTTLGVVASLASYLIVNFVFKELL